MSCEVKHEMTPCVVAPPVRHLVLPTSESSVSFETIRVMYDITRHALKSLTNEVAQVRCI